jgi:hypothetical protein
LLVDAARAACRDADPVIVHYRELGERGWSGRIAGEDLDNAAVGMRNLLTIAGRHDLTLQATSASCGNTTVAAARVPELDFATAPRFSAEPVSIGL